ncbi:uncharacterized protein N7511_007691 [Penicillium nucicola]|uniref:uncharacterized protein n=1 Tax=Penicillium nucicola TaxID=1850975 RepID=UPI0025452960|nr:uncharacterized protein N7511_007691 [Penicillium nucicola]KAJ5753538.1 hypothetical protein N7511_007691 [Penicillium nucicola]
MSDFLRRASDAFHHRERQDSTSSTGSAGSMDAPISPNAAKLPEQQPANQKFESAQPASQASNPSADTATKDLKNRHSWGWGNKHGKIPDSKQQPNQKPKDSSNDWIFAS